MIPFEEMYEKALSLGYQDMGVTEAKVPPQDLKAYQKWLGRGYHADLDYMAKKTRESLDNILEGAKTAIIFVSYYKQEKVEFEEGRGVIASYARGKKYHNVHNKRIKQFIQWLETRSNQKGIARGFSDSKPILEKALAVQAGLGWFGKNTLLIHRKFGTFTLLSGVLTTLELAPSKEPVLHEMRCGSCTKCLDACPTKALTSPYELDANLCLSYHTIESKKQTPSSVNNPGYIFGCDLCQDSCPHNARKPISTSKEFKPDQGMGTFITEEKLKSIEDKPDQLYGTPLQRAGADGLARNFLHFSQKKNS